MKNAGAATQPFSAQVLPGSNKLTKNPKFIELPFTLSRIDVIKCVVSYIYSS